MTWWLLRHYTGQERNFLNANVSEIMRKSGLSRDAFLAEVSDLLRTVGATASTSAGQASGSR